eukprot:11810516-Karenia_brevis.AAC.1
MQQIAVERMMVGIAPKAHRVEVGLAPQGLEKIWYPQLMPSTEADWLQGPQGTISVAHALEVAGFP